MRNVSRAFLVQNSVILLILFKSHLDLENWKAKTGQIVQRQNVGWW